LIAYHIGLVAPYIGGMAIESVHSGTLEAFCDDRLEGDFEKEWRPVTPTTVNRSLEVVRTILNKAARVWRDDEGRPWLSTAPLIEMLAETGARPAYPITWEQQHALFKELPSHLFDMALFAVNTGSRDDNICGLEWAWERNIPQLGRSVFVIPAARFKGKRPHVVILNDVAWRVVESRRGRHDRYVFTYQDPVRGRAPNRVETINNSAWQKARRRAGLEQVRVHDLRHTYGQRLRDAGVSNEDRAVLLGHKSQGMSEHYATPTVAKLIEMANKVQETRDTPTLLRMVNG
jgi:integrase